MTEETAQFFDAPLSVISIFPGYDIITSGGKELFAHAYTEENAHRLASLPELYDALVCASFEYCKGCTKSFSSPDSFLSAGCAGKDGFCPAVFWWETLRKVRDGK